MKRLPIVLAVTPIAERAVEHLVFGRAAAVEPRASVADADELEREVEVVEGVTVLLSPDLTGLTSAHCARVRAGGARIAGLAMDSQQRQQLLALGVDDVVDPDASEEAFLAALRGQGDNDEEWTAAAAEPLNRVVAPGGGGNSSVLAVIGCKGAPGSSECAASLAALAMERWSCVLAELDALGGGLDLRLGADPGNGSLLGVARAVRGGDDALSELLERWLTVRDGWPPVLVGAPDPENSVGELVDPGVVAATLRALALIHPLIVADVGFLLAEGEQAGPVCRIHREAVVAADAVLLVLGAREEQLRSGLDQLDSLLGLGIEPQRLRVIVNGTDGPGASTRSSLEPVINVQLAERRIALDAWLPWDGRALARAQRTGLSLGIARRRGPYARALGRLLEELFLPVAPSPRERKLRLVAPQAHVEEIEDGREVALSWRR